MKEEKKKNIGKFLSLVLRHSPDTIGIELDANGWADTKELIAKCAKKGKHFTMDELEEIVATNEKKRYAFNEDKSKIRANQGHSIDVDLSLSPAQPPEFLYHGTADRFCQLIGKEGIKKMNRQHVHLSAHKQTATTVGSRHGRPYIITVLAGKMYADGIAFYQSDNGVWLTDYIDPKYFSK